MQMQMTDIEITQHALSIVRAQASVRTMTPDEIVEMARKVHSGILGMVNQEGPAIPSHLAEPAMSPGDAIKERSVHCLECGKAFKVLTKKHLASHGLTPKEYKAKHGYKPGVALIAKGLARDRRKKMGELRLWEKRGERANG